MHPVPKEMNLLKPHPRCPAPKFQTSTFVHKRSTSNPSPPLTQTPNFNRSFTDLPAPASNPNPSPSLEPQPPTPQIAPQKSNPSPPRDPNDSGSGFFFIGDGIIDNIFHFLWTKDNSFGSLTGINIPDTIMFDLNEMKSWYFSSQGSVKKKLKAKLNSEEIKRVFLKGVGGSGVVAVFIHKTVVGGGKGFEFEYFDRKRFIEFVEDKKVRKHGVLQRFVSPTGDYNFVIRANWNQHFCVYEKKIAKRKLGEKKFDIYERCATFDGKPYMSRSEAVHSDIVKGAIDTWINAIVRHIKKASKGFFKPNSMILNFTIDANQHLYFLYCSSVKSSPCPPSTIKNAPNTIDKLNYSLPPKIDPSFNTLPHNLTKNYLCTSCFKNSLFSKTYEVSYATIIKWAGRPQPPNISRASEINHLRTFSLAQFTS